MLVKSGADVQVIMTEAAKDFVGELSLSSLSGKAVLSQIHNDQQWNEHVRLGLWADLMVVAPATANTIAKMANGLADNFLTAVYLSAKCPVMVAPAMDLDMWQHGSTRKNISTLASYGIDLIDVGEGPLASGLSGPGRLAEPEQIFQAIAAKLNPVLDFKGKTVLVTAGPTYEDIDPVRFIGNHSSGKMGIRIAEQAASRGANVILILGPSKEEIKHSEFIKLIRIRSASELLSEVKANFESVDCFILAAAVADFKPAHKVDQKIKKNELKDMSLALVPTEDIAFYVGEHKNKGQKLVGFALETNSIMEHAQQKLKKKNMDMIVINSPNSVGEGFGYDTNKVAVLYANSKLKSFELKSKTEVASDILNEVITLFE